MHRIDGPGHLANQFTEGDPQQGQAPTTVTDDWANAVQEEIAAVIEGAGIALVKGQQDQLLAALDARFAPLTPYTGHFAPIGSGTAVTAINTTVALTALDATHVVLVDETNDKLKLYSVDYGTGVFTLIGSGTAVTAITSGDGLALTALDATHVVLVDETNGKLFLYSVDPGTGVFTLIGSGTAVTAFIDDVALTALDATHVVLAEQTNDKLYLYSVDPGTGVFTLIGSGTAVTGFNFSVALTALDATHVVLGNVTNDKLFLHDAVVHKGRAAPWSAAGGAF
jgi:hypothetical protein